MPLGPLALPGATGLDQDRRGLQPLTSSHTGLRPTLPTATGAGAKTRGHAGSGPSIHPPVPGQLQEAQMPDPGG